jgi:small subunit ribosomal protein S13
MAIVSGVNIPDNKRVEISLQHVYGIGLTTAKQIVEKVAIDGNPHVRELTETQLTRIREIVDRDTRVEGDLRRETNMNIRRLIDIGSYRGTRHRRGLPVRGQRTRTNARAKRGRRVPVAGRRHTVTRT